MNPVPELVALPDPTVTPLVHPVDLPDARRPFLVGLLVANVAGPLAALAAAAATWAAVRLSLLAAVAGGIALGVGYIVAERYYRDAWAHIPRKRQDRDRELPLGWDLVGRTGKLTVLLFCLGLAESAARLSAYVREFVVALLTIMVVGTAVHIVVAAIRGVRSKRGARRTLLLDIPLALAVMGAVGFTAWRLLDGMGLPVFTTAILGAFVVVNELLDRRRRKSAPDAATARRSRRYWLRLD
jgi:hypothetical protein